MEHSWTFTYYTAPHCALLSILLNGRGDACREEFLRWSLSNSNSSVLEQFKSAFIRKYYFSPLVNASVLLITTKILTFGFVVAIQEGLFYSITRHHSYFKQMSGNSWGTNQTLWCSERSATRSLKLPFWLFFDFFSDTMIFFMRMSSWGDLSVLHQW